MQGVENTWIFALGIVIAVWVISLAGLVIHLTWGSSKTNYEQHVTNFSWVSVTAAAIVIVAISVLYANEDR